MPVKTVTLRIIADAGDAQAKLDEITAKADKLDAEEARVRVRVDAPDLVALEARVKATQALLKDKGFGDAVVRIRVDGAGKAVAELAAVRAAEEETAGGGGLLSRLGGLFGGGGGLGALATSPAGIAAIGAGIATLVPEIVSVANGFVAAGAGAGAFYLLAHPAINNLQGDVQALDKANQALGYAQQKYLIDPTKAHAKALHEAQVTYQAIYQAMGQDAGSAAAQVLKLHSAYVKVTNAFQPQAFRILGDVAKILTNALPSLTPFANAFTNALDPLLKRLAGFTASKGFGDFIKQFSGLTGPAVTAIGEGIGKVAVSIGKLLTTMNAGDVAKGIGIAFNTIAAVINGLAVVLSRGMRYWDNFAGAAKTATHDVVASWSTAIGFIQGIPGKIEGAFKSAGSWLLGAGKAIIGGLVHGIESAASGMLGGAMHSVASMIRSFLPFSPAKQGPLSGQGSPDIAGAKIVTMLAAGIRSALPVLGDALTGVTDVTLKRLGALVLKGLAAQKAALQAQIQQAQQVTSSEITNASVMSAGTYTSALAGGPQPAALTIGGLTSMAADMAQFRAVIAQLRRMGLNAISLGQIISAGSSQGLPVALGLAQGGPGSIAQINRLESQIKGSAIGIGNVGGPVLYQAGLQAAQGVAAGLKTQLAAVTQASNQLAAAMKGAGKAELAVTVDVRLSEDKQALALQIVKVLKEYKRHGGGAPLGIS